MSDRDETTPQERQRVAQRLRDQPTFDMYTDYEECLGYLCDAVTGKDDGMVDPELWTLQRDLADLIDPTCHAEPVVYEHLYGMEHTDLVKCSECHTVWLEPDRVRYCPTCGARRVFEEGDGE